MRVMSLLLVGLACSAPVERPAAPREQPRAQDAAVADVPVDAAAPDAPPISASDQAAIDVITADRRPDERVEFTVRNEGEPEAEAVGQPRPAKRPMWCVLDGENAGVCMATRALCQREAARGRGGRDCDRYARFSCVEFRVRSRGARARECATTEKGCGRARIVLMQLGDVADLGDCATYDASAR